MKLNKFILTLAVAALLPTFAYAGDDSDSIRASFERDLQCESVISSASKVSSEADPLTEAVRAALYGEPTDQVVASFERALNHAPVTVMAMLFIEADPLEDSIRVALNDLSTDQIVASVDRDLNRVVI